MIINDSLTHIDIDKLDIAIDTNDLSSLITDISSKVTKLRSQLASRTTSDTITTILFPSIRWYQSPTEIGLSIKLSTK